MLNWCRVVCNVIHNALITVVTASSTTTGFTSCSMIQYCCDPHAVWDDDWVGGSSPPFIGCRSLLHLGCISYHDLLEVTLRKAEHGGSTQES